MQAGVGGVMTSNAQQAEPSLIRAIAAAALDDELGGSLLAHLKMLPATTNNRTVIEDLMLRVGLVLKIARMKDEAIDSLLQRIITAVERMPATAYPAIELRAGLKALGVSLPELAAAIRNPDTAQAARLAARVEMPNATPARSAANAAIASYLQPEARPAASDNALAMRGDNRTLESRLGLFSERVAIPQPVNRNDDPRQLQQHLKTMFEAGENRSVSRVQLSEANLSPQTEPTTTEGGEMTSASQTAKAGREIPNVVEGRQIEKLQADTQIPPLEPQDAHQSERANKPDASTHAKTERRDSLKSDPGDKRLQTLLTLKGISEVITQVIDAVTDSSVSRLTEQHAQMKAARELQQAIVPSSDEAPEQADPMKTASIAKEHRGDPLRVSDSADDLAADQRMMQDRSAATGGTAATTSSAQTEQEAKHLAGNLPGQLVPFAVVNSTPAREAFVAETREEEARDETDGDDSGDEQSEGRERRRPRDAYDAIHDPVEEEDGLKITRDSTDADRAFAYYQRLGGF
jgi:hypothetical protein